MKTIKALASLLCLLGFPAHAKMVFEETLVSFDVKPDTKEVLARFPFKVTEGGASIKNYDAPCTCLSARIEPVLENGKARLNWDAGSTGEVKGKFEIGNMSGTVTKLITLNFHNQDSVKLRVQIKMPKIVEITPTTYRWKQGEAAQERIYQIKIKGDDPVRITDVKSISKNFPAELITVKEGREYQLKVKPGSTAQPSLGIIRLLTDSKYKRFKRLQAFGVVQAATK